jgi:general nucleoside transport system ATP-binding protein
VNGPSEMHREEVALALSNITKRFGEVTAVDDVSLELRRGTVHALLGENGAGKSTLMRIAFGLVAADAGTVAVHGRSVFSTADAINAGVGMVHQHFTNVAAMTVAENVALGARGRFNAATAARNVIELGSRTGLQLDPLARADTLPVGAQQRLEILKALARSARVLILDEPTAVLAPNEATELLAWLRAFARSGNAVILITHKLREALSIADEITVLRRGRRVVSGPASMSIEQLSAALLGENAIASVREESASGSDVVVARLSHVVATDSRGVTTLRDVSLTVHAGEILGVAAVEGSGQHELLRALGKRIVATSGVVEVPDAIGFVPEDRHRDALVLDFDAPENVALKNAHHKRGRLAWQSIRASTRSIMESFDVRGRHDAAVRTFSGGNQQKLVLARELIDDPSLLVVENPTRGLDIRATAAVHQRLRDIAKRGTAIVLYSSDLDEVLELATRVVVIHAGTVTEVPRDRDAVGRAMLGVA